MKTNSNRIILGKNDEEFVFSKNEKHVLVCGSSGSGKTAGFTIPNILCWSNSLVIHSHSTEVFKKTSAWRKKSGNKVFLWEPGSKSGLSHRYNPFDFISDDFNEMPKQLHKLAEIILPMDDYWHNEARSFFVGVSLFLKSYASKHLDIPCNFSELLSILKGDDTIYNMAVILDEFGKKIHPISYNEIAYWLQKSDTERAEILVTLINSLYIFSLPGIATLTEKSDFDLNKIRKEKTTIYTVISQDDRRRLKLPLQMFYSQLTDSLCDDKTAKSKPVLLMIDDYFSLEELDLNINFLRNYNIRLCAIFQNYSQIEESGLNDNTFGNFGYKIIYSINDIKTKRAFNTVVYYANNGKILPKEFNFANDKKALLLTESDGASEVEKIYYYKESFFKQRVLKSIKIPKHNFKKHPKRDLFRVESKKKTPYLSLIYDAENKDNK